MFERFTNRARRVVVLAQEEARLLKHNYIGTEHLLLALIHEGQGVAARALAEFELPPLDQLREDVTKRVGTGATAPSGHIPFTPRAKKVLELSLREALSLHHKYIGTEHILLGLLREGEGVAAQMLREYAGDLLKVRMAVIDVLPAATALQGHRWLRRQARVAGGEFDPVNVRVRYGEAAETVAGTAAAEAAEVHTTPAADASLTEAQRLAGARPVGSHHLLLAALADADTAAARVLSGLGLDLDRAKEALRQAEVTGTSDEEPADAGRRQMVIKVTDDRVTLEAADEIIVGIGKTALKALGDQASPPGTISGNLPSGSGLTKVWQALSEALEDIRRRAAAAAEGDEPEESGERPAG
jgi:ATP-dependent Clp protease ATP-binding subunit ClpC